MPIIKNKVIIETVGLTKKFDKLVAVDKLDLSVEEGEIFGLLGPNGAGKTTTLSMLATLLPPSGGTARVNGFDVAREASRVRASIGFVFQDPSSDDLLTGRENLYLHSLMYGVDMRTAQKKIDAALKLVDLTDRQNERVKKYSGGMRRRLELARGLLHEPKILFLDEPTLGLDPQTREHLWKYIKRLSTEKKVTIIITTHYMEEADSLCDRVAIIDHGKIVALDSPANLKKGLGGDVVYLSFAKPNKPNLAAVRKMKCVRNVKLEKCGKESGKSGRDGCHVTLSCDAAASQLQNILKVIGKVESVESRSPTLNDVFLHFTGKEIRDGADGGGAEGDYHERMMHSGNR